MIAILAELLDLAPVLAVPLGFLVALVEAALAFRALGQDGIRNLIDRYVREVHVDDGGPRGRVRDADRVGRDAPWRVLQIPRVWIDLGVPCAGIQRVLGDADTVARPR